MADAIASLVEKISEYKLFNYLLPGSVYLISSRYVAGAVPFENNVMLFLLAAYFVGMVLSRVGSLIIEPVLRWVRFVRFCDYRDFVKAESVDPKLTSLSQENNTYRSMTSVFAVLLIEKVALALRPKFTQWDQVVGWALPISFLLLFVFSHRKQCRYIVRRVEANKK